MSSGSNGSSVSRRDGRIDLLRGFALLTIFVDHIPDNVLAAVTMHNFGFSDAAELFVLLAGFSTATAYGGVIDRKGLAAGAYRVAKRCLSIYGVHIVLFLGTLATVALWSWWSGRQPKFIGPLLQDGWRGVLRGLSLSALPTYLDILPLYIVLLAMFPFIWLAARVSVMATLAASFLLYAVANLTHLNLPNVIDPLEPKGWYFDPFTWQLIFMMGIAGAIWTRGQPLRTPPAAITGLCAAYVVFALVVSDPWQLWPAPFGPNFAGPTYPFALFGNEPKTFVTPWRLLHALALGLLMLSSTRLSVWSKMAMLRPLVACGRHSLLVFASGCFLALVGRLFLSTVGPGLAQEIVVNLLGLTLLLLVGVTLEDARVKTAKQAGTRLRQVDDARRHRTQPTILVGDLKLSRIYSPPSDLDPDMATMLNRLSSSLQALTDAPDASTELRESVRYRSAQTG